MLQSAPIPRDHIAAKARLLSEGVRLLGPKRPRQRRADAAVDVACEPARRARLDIHDVEQVLRSYAETIQSRARTPIKEVGNVIHFDDSGLTAPLIANDRSRLELRREGERVTISDGDDLLVSARLPRAPAWTRETLCNGLAVTSVLPNMSAGIINVLFSLSCINTNSRRGCHYCNLFANPVAAQLTMLPMKTLEGYARYQAEAVKIATDAGWRGTLSFSGGALPPAQRGETIERIGVVMAALRDAVDADILAALPKVYNNYPPEELEQLGELADIGFTATSIDIEVMSPSYFAAICPGKHAYRPHEHWLRAQEASVDIFGPYANTTGFVIVGLEPLASLVAGMQERLGKGVLPLPFVFYSSPGSPYWGFRPPTAEWLVEATDALADALMPFVPQVMQSLASYAGAAPSAPSFANCMLFDELQRRLQLLLGGASRADQTARASGQTEPLAQHVDDEGLELLVTTP